MTRHELIEKLSGLSDEHFARVAPYLQADLEAADDLEDLHAEIEGGRRSATTEPLVDAKDVYAHVRSALAE